MTAKRERDRKRRLSPRVTAVGPLKPVEVDLVDIRQAKACLDSALSLALQAKGRPGARPTTAVSEALMADASAQTLLARRFLDEFARRRLDLGVLVQLPPRDMKTVCRVLRRFANRLDVPGATKTETDAALDVRRIADAIEHSLVKEKTPPTQQDPGDEDEGQDEEVERAEAAPAGADARPREEASAEERPAQPLGEDPDRPAGPAVELVPGALAPR